MRVRQSPHACLSLLPVLVDLACNSKGTDLKYRICDALKGKLKHVIVDSFIDERFKDFAPKIPFLLIYRFLSHPQS